MDTWNETVSAGDLTPEGARFALEWLAERMPGGFFVYRADFTQELVYVNRAALDIFGCDTAEQLRELTGWTFPGMVHPEDRAAVQSSIDTQIAGGEGNLDFVEYRILRADGAVRWVGDYGRFALLPGYGQVYYVFIEDITDSRRIREENRRAALVIEGLSVDYASIYLLDLESGNMRPYRLKNAFFHRISRDIGLEEGQNADWRQVLGAYAERFVVPEDRETFLREVSAPRLRQRLREELSYSVNYRCRFEDADLAYVRMSVMGIESDGGRRAVLGFRDVTEETREIQREMSERLHTELELNKARHLDEIKNQFLFHVSHDIRTPMNAVMGFTGLARKHMDDPAHLREDLDRVEESGAQLLELIDDLLDMSKLENDSMELKLEPCSLQEQLRMTAELFQAQAEAKKLRLTEHTELPEGQVLADAHRLRRILGNLLSNAVKFTPEGGSVTLSARREPLPDSPCDRYIFTVADTGVGMTEEFMGRMFRAFERESSSTVAGTRGIGLGLSIVKHLAVLMGGSVTAESRKGEGSVFTVVLPLQPVSGGTESGGAADAEEAGGEYRALGDHRVLLVEDIELNRMLAETVLEEAGFRVESVPDGSDAVEAVKNHPAWYYDLILMDIQMPVMDGYAATRAIRGMDREDIPSLPIIALSANAREEDRRQSVESGMNSHVAKPFDVAQLIAAINSHIMGRERPAL